MAGWETLRGIVITNHEERTMTKQTLSRRSFSTLIAASAAYAAVGQRNVKGSWRRFGSEVSPVGNVVRLSSNENPYGPSAAALKAMTDGFSLAWRYPDEHADLLVEELARINSVPLEQVLLGDGSGEILKLAAAAFTNNDKKIVVANPTFEAIARHASVSRAEVVKIDLTSDYRHDVQKMLAAANGAASSSAVTDGLGNSAGLVYICNPNN